MSPVIIKRINDYKESLLKFQQKSDDENKEAILDILSNLDKCSVDVNILAATLIGATVSKFKSNSDSEIALKAKTLIKKWKQLAKQSGVGSGKKNGSGNETSASANNGNSNGSAEKQKKRPSISNSKPTAAAAAATTTPSESIDAWDYLPSNRKNSAMKLHQLFLQSKSSLATKTQFNSDEIASTIITKATEVEEAIQSYSKGNKQKYVEKIRSLVFNLKKNAPLREDILLSYKTPSQLVTMTAKELQTIEKAKERCELAASLQGSRRLDWEQANADKVNEMCGIKGELLKASLFTCGRCKSHKTTSTQKQTRSADEPMTVFVFCENCGNRWKC